MEVNKPQIATHLLWEYDLKDFDFKASRRIVIGRVIERGSIEDWKAIFSFYGKAAIEEVALSSKQLSSKDRTFTTLFLDSTLLSANQLF